MRSAKINIWLIMDGKRGHEKQSEYLAQALQNLADIEIIKMDGTFVKPFISKLLRLFNFDSIKKPDLIIGTGHATHLHMIFSKILNGGKTVVIMKPSLPHSWFDLCFIPKHDGVPEKPGIFLTNGSINNIENEKRHNKSKGLIVLGGESKHFIWDTQVVIDQINNIINQNPKIRFKIATSRRTPKDFIDHLDTNLKKNIPVYEYEKVKENWFMEEAKLSKFAWVTEDSISMIYELIASGSNITPIRLENKYDSKISNEISRLVNTGLISAYDGKRKKTNNSSFNNEAKRCANFILNKWFKS
jgi:mitochondrial fission protein ELM1